MKCQCRCVKELQKNSLMEVPEFWEERARDQIRLTSGRLRRRGAKKQLPLPPESVWKLELQGQPERKEVDGHDMVLISYTMTGTVLTDFESPGISEPQLKQIGGIWREPFILPLDPELLFSTDRFCLCP